MDERRRSSERPRPTARRRSRHGRPSRLPLALAVLVVIVAVMVVAAAGVQLRAKGAAPTPASSAKSDASAKSASKTSATASSGSPTPASAPPESQVASAPPAAPPPYQWAKRYGTVAHGMGAIDQVSWTNSVEAFERNYRRGYRVFEVDFILTRDGKIVARHEWSDASFHKLQQMRSAHGIPTLAEFKRMKILGKYEPVAATDVVRLLEAHPDAYVMTDVKDADTALLKNALRQLSAAIGNRDSVRKRIIVQIYQESDFAPARKLGYVNFVYTFYHLTTSRTRGIEFAKSHGIKVITIPYYIASADLVSQIRRAGLIPAVHTVNQPSWVTDFQRRHVPIVYSDWLPPVTYKKTK